MISEAISWNKGTIDNPCKHVVEILSDNVEVYFLKPGKETEREKNNNPFDMTPQVGNSGIKMTFQDIWGPLSKIAGINEDYFKYLLVLIYRNAYLLDHTIVNGKVRYEPNEQILSVITDIDDSVGKYLPYGTLGFLHFLNILGWNEDVKYHHTDDGKPTFDGKYDYNVGRINTLLTCIRIPYETYKFVEYVHDIPNLNNIDYKKVFTQMQQLAVSRGTCVPTQTQLLEWLSPILYQ
ncbi:hypothetical protein CUJ83_02520 [Methanocella sp. CWC-04]|uniref:Uncharacterized protein n=1 Tax=Methanooceanicella nereidis TaxID=2052831 RepID=A0AAP2RBA7_9EURY|nr:hypothetical protein [Methanocella sp. CWC-04]MCD1293872.1 hypothetical protein [Methanocella sp. CWC-04]